ncbi:hypothetical protein QFZ96_008208 [Paraburkholderia youngii]
MDEFVGGVIVNTARDRRALDYLLAECGNEAVERARASLAGQRKPYVSNIAKVLGVVIPDAVVITPRDEAREKLSHLKAILKGRS